MRALLCCDVVGGKGAVALLILRLVAGAAFILHGYPKMQHAFTWMQGSSFPGWLQALAAFAEFGGGIALIVGFLTRIAAFGLACTMFVAIFMVHIPMGHPFVGKDGAWELAAVYLAIMITFLLRGPGVISLDALVFGSKK